MDRSREGRRAGAGGGPAYAPRRPRTGFKEASAGDDADDMDDSHNPRLRERLKKDHSGLVLGQSAVTISRNKRKRQGSQEMQVQARNSPVDDLDEVTEDTEMGVSEDDDDPPPPIIPRRPGKPRPQGKIPEDSVCVDLPAVPRKARTAILKRPQESVLPLSADPPSLQPSRVFPSAPAPSSTPSSSSIASLKPGRRMKPSGTKPRGSKLPKVSTPVMVSEQEVEVAEALFDLARMFTQPTSSTMELKLEEKSSHIDYKSETKVDSKAFESAATLIIETSNGPFNTISTSFSAPTPSSPLPGPVTALSPVHASAVSVIHHTSPPLGAAPAAEAPRRKRPRVRTRLEEGTSNLSGVAANPATDLSSATVTSSSQSKDADYILIQPSITDTCGMKEEANTGTTVIPALPSVANATVTFSMPSLASATAAVIPVLPCTVASGSVPRPSPSLEKKSSNTEKKNVISVAKVNVSNYSLVENNSIVQSAVGKRPKANLPGSALLDLAEEASCCTTAPAGLLTTKLESPQPADGVNGDQTVRPQIDLMVSPTKLPAALTNNRNIDDPDAAMQNLPEQANVEMAIASTSETLWLDETMEREEKELLETDKEKDREWERDEQNEVDARKEDPPIERETKKERARYDSSKLPGQRSSKSLKADVGRSQKAASATSFSGNPSTSTFATGVASNVAGLPLSMGLLSWPGGLPGGVSYFPAAAAAAAVADENPSSVQMPPYIMPPRQAWKRCALHVYIARFIDMQQQLSSHHAFFPSTNHLYGAKPYNLNIPLSTAESLLGSAVGALPVGNIAGPSAPTSSTAVVNLEAGEHGLNSAATSTHGVKECSFNLDLMNRKLPAQQQQSVQQQSTIPVHVGPMLGFPGTHNGTASVTGALPTSATCVPNANMLPGVAVAVANTAAGSSSPNVGGPSSAGGLPSAATIGSTATAAVQAQYMHAMMQQSQKFSFAQYPPPPFCPTTFNAPPPHVGAQQAAAQFFAGGPFFTTHMMPHSQQQPGQQIVNSVSGGSASTVKQQQGTRTLASASSPQQQGAQPQSPSHSQHQLPSNLQRPLDKDGPVVGDNGSSVDSKFPILHRSVYGQAPQNAAVANVNPPITTVLSGMVQSVSSHSLDYNMVGVLGKLPKQQSHQSSGQQQLQSQQPPALSAQLQQQHHSHGAPLQMNVKEPQTTQSFSMSIAGAMSRGSAVGPGPIGLAPVAAVMAPQGHAMLQSVGESGSFHPSQTPHPQLGAGSTHSNLLQQQHHQQLQQQHLIQMHQAQQLQTHPLQQQQLQQHQNQNQQNHQRAPQVGRGASSGPEESRTIVDANLSTISNRGREREIPDDRKMSVKRSIVTLPPLSREMEGCTSVQSSLGVAACMTSSRNVGTALNLLASTHPNMSSRSSVPLSQQQVVQTTKQTPARSKGTNSPSQAGTNQSALSSFSDRVSLAGASLPGKVASPGLLLSGQQIGTASSQVSRQAQLSQTAQMKLNQRTASGQQGVPTAPTAPGTPSQVVLAAAMAKSPQLQQQQQQQRAQQATNACSNSRLSATHTGPLPSSPGPLPPLPPVSKSAGLNPPKTSSSQKGSFTVSQKAAVSAGKRSSSPSSLPHVSSVLGPSPLAQNMSAQNMLGKNAQHQQMHQQPTPQQQLQAPPQNSLQGQQQQRYHSQQQAHHPKQSLPLQQNQQHTQQVMRQHLLQQQQQQQQQQQLHMFQQHQQPASQSPQAAHSQQQPSQQLGSHQQQSTHQQHQPQHLQQQQQPQSPFPSSHANSGLTLGSSLSMGTGNNSCAASSIRNHNPDSGGVSQNRQAHSSKQLVNPSIPVSSNSGTPRSNSTGPGFLQQFGSSALPSGQQQSGSPRNSNPSPYMQACVNSVGGARATDAKALPDGAEQLNGVRTMQGSSPGRSPSTVSSSPTLHPPSQRTHTGGPSSKPAAGHFTDNNHGDTIQPRSGVLLSASNSSPSNSSPNGQLSSNANVHIGGDSRTAFVSSAPVSLNQGSLDPCQMHPTSSLSMASAAVAPSGLSPLGNQQPSTSVVQP